MANIKWSAFPSGSLMQSGDETVGLRGGLDYRFDFPGTGIKNATGTYLLNWADVGAAAVNYLQTSNSISASPVLINALGTDADVSLTITAKGAGVITAASNLILNTSAPTLPLQAASKGYVDSVIPTYPISLAHGGTNANLTASNGGIFYSTATAGAILSGTATANQILLSGLSSAPSWSTATYPATTTINQFLYSSAANTITGLATGNSGVLITSNTGVPSFLANSGITGNMLRSNSAAPPSWSTAMFADTYTVNDILYASSSNSVTGLATANNGVLITSGVGVPSISSTLPTAVQSNITQLGTISSGTWNGSVISSIYGGTGVNNGGSTITVGANFTMSGGFTFTGTLTGATAVTFPTSGTLATTSQIPSLPLSLSNGGTGASLTASNGGIVYSGASAMGILSGTATANQVILSGSNTTPSWSTATYPATTTINQILYSSSANTITGLATGNTTVLTTNGSGVPSLTMGYSATGGTSNMASRDANGNSKFNNVYGALTSNAAGGTVTLTAASSETQVFSGVGASTLVLPDATTLSTGFRYFVNNNSSGIITVQYNDLSTALSIPSSQYVQLIVTSIGTTNGTWDWHWLIPASMANGQVLIGGGTSGPKNATLTAGTNVTITNAANSITINATAAGTVNSGTANQLAYYATTGTAVSGLTSANSKVLTTDASGVPTWSNTVVLSQINDTNLNTLLSFTATASAVNYVSLTNNSSGNNPIIAAVGADTNLSLILNGKGTGGCAIGGTSTNDNAGSGYVGEIQSSIIDSGSAVSISTATDTNLTSISLTAGDWDVWGNLYFIPTVSMSSVAGWVSSTSATAPNASRIARIAVAMTSDNALCVPSQRFSLASTTTVYISGKVTITSGTVTFCGGIYARRRR